MNPLSEESKLVILGLIVAVVVAGSAFTVTKLLAAGADREKAAVLEATQKAQAAAAAISTVWQGRATAAEQSQGSEHAAIQSLRDSVAALPGQLRQRAVPPVVPAAPAASVGHDTATAAVVRESVVCASSHDLRSEYGEALRADDLAADARVLFDSWPTMPPPK